MDRTPDRDLSNRAGAAGSPASRAPPGDWHALPAGTVLSQLGVPDGGEGGLTAAEARSRLERFGANALAVPDPVSAWTILLNQFRGVIVLLLVAAALVAWALGDTVEALAILAVLVINAAIGFATEYRARGAMAALLRMEVPRATAVRDGAPAELDARDLVPGDIILLTAGQAVPADARLLTSTELRTSEAPLTGESLPVSKDPAATLAADVPLADRVTAVYMTTSVVAGTGRAVVTATGMQTEVGRIGGLVSGITDEKTPLEARLDALGHRLVWLTLVVAAVVIGMGVWRGEPWGLMIEIGIALAIAAVPEGLPAVSTIALAVGVARMARRNALVRRLPAVEALGSATTVCTDKTGTLTAGEMTVSEVWTADGPVEVSGVGYAREGQFLRDGQVVDPEADPGLALALRIGALSNRASLEASQDDATVWSIRGDPTEAALLVAAAKAGMPREALLGGSPERGEVPFSSERMFMATFHDGRDGVVGYVKGAPDRLLDRSRTLHTGAGPRPLDAATRAMLQNTNEAMAGRGLRVLGLALAPTPRPADGADGVRDLEFVGLVGLSDPPAAGVLETIRRFRTAGIRTVMITGDQRLTAAAVARALEIADTDAEVVDAGELHGLDPGARQRRMAGLSVLSRVSPEDKLRIVEGFQDRGEVVAMLGDGVNDAAALKRADIGVAMGVRGTDVAREASDVVLQDDRFRTIGAAVEEGRVIFDNIRKFVFYLFSCNLAEVLVILGAGLLALPQPLLPLQILWLNLVTDTFPALSLAVEPAEREVMRRPPRDPQRAILSGAFLRRIAAYGLLITAATLAAFAWALTAAPSEPARAVTVAFMTLALAQIFHLGTARAREPLLRWRDAAGNRWAVGAVVLTIGLQLLAVYFAPLAELLGVVPLSVGDWLRIVPLALAPAVVGQVVAGIRVRRDRGAGPRRGSGPGSRSARDPRSRDDPPTREDVWKLRNEPTP